MNATKSTWPASTGLLAVDPPSPLKTMVDAAPQPTALVPSFTPRKRARKIKSPLGPYETHAKVFDQGKDRAVEIVAITAAAIIYRLVGRAQEYALPHSTAMLKAMSVKAGFDAGPRESTRIRRGQPVDQSPEPSD